MDEVQAAGVAADGVEPQQLPLQARDAGRGEAERAVERGGEGGVHRGDQDTPADVGALGHLLAPRARSRWLPVLRVLQEARRCGGAERSRRAGDRSESRRS